MREINFKKFRERLQLHPKNLKKMRTGYKVGYNLKNDVKSTGLPIWLKTKQKAFIWQLMQSQQLSAHYSKKPTA